MTDDEIIVALATIVVFGIGAQWLGRRTGIPSLLILLPAGLLAGDVFELVNPEELFGDLLFPSVTLLVSLLLFQSGMELRLSELPEGARSSVARMVSIGLAITFLGASLAVAAFLDVPTELAFMAGAILVVSGPTVVGPLLDVVRPREPTGSLLKWEGTALDPIGATLGVVVLNLILASDRGGVHPVLQMLTRLGLGITVGLVAAGLLVFVMSRFLLTDNMEASVALLFAVAAFAVAEVLLSEAGLFATVTLGFVVANQRVVNTTRITGFSETLEVLIIGTLFIVLGALVEIDAIREYAVEILLIVAALVLVVRPITAAVALLGTPLAWRARALVGWMDPRGIVAAATATQFSATLSIGGYDSDFLTPVVFGVILGTGIIYGLTAKPVAKLLGVARPAAHGVALLGDDPWLVSFGGCLLRSGASTLLVTSREAAAQPLATGSEVGVTTIELHQDADRIAQAARDASMAQMVVSAPPHVITTAIESRMIEVLGRRHVLSMPSERADLLSDAIPGFWSARPFAGRISREKMMQRIEAGATIEIVSTPAPDGVLPLAIVGAGGKVNLRPKSVDVAPGEVLIGLVEPGA